MSDDLAILAESLEAENARLRAFMRELSDALLAVRPLGGSELFVKRFGNYYADPAYCKAAIEKQAEDYHNAMKAHVRNSKRADAAESALAEAVEVMRPVADVTLPWGDIGAGMILASDVQAARAICSATRGEEVMTAPTRAIEAGARAIVAAEYDDEFYPFETSSKAEQQLARRQAEAMLAALAAEGFVVVPAEATARMVCAALDDFENRAGKQRLTHIYAAMITAAQQEQNDAGE